MCYLTTKQISRGGGGGFNISGELLVENMKELSLIRQRIVCDRFSVNKSHLHNYQVHKKLLLSCKGARMKNQFVAKKSRKRKLFTDKIVLVKKEMKDLFALNDYMIECCLEKQKEEGKISYSS